MADNRDISNDRPEPSFKTVELLKEDEHVLGAGAYGKVCKAKCDELLCAAKVIHETLVVPNGGAAAARRRHRLPLQRFMQECRYLSTIKHPNIVQYLGQWQDPDSGLPVLLMELMDGSLTSFLEKPPEGEAIPLHVQVNICHDVSLALVFLHCNRIVHRDLSGNNVLMIGNGVRAKVSDFGMARMMETSAPSGLSGDSPQTVTLCPGADVYMPPEAVNNSLEFSEKMDCFSFGVIILQLLTRKFPAPGNRHRTVRHYFGKREEVVPEVERRRRHISEVDSRHPLRQVFLDCLKDKSNDRPTAQTVCQQLAALKNSSQYRESVNEVLCSLCTANQSLVGRKEKENVDPLEESGESLRKELQQLRREISQKDQEISKVRTEKNRIEEQLRKVIDPNKKEKRRDNDKKQKGREKVTETTKCLESDLPDNGEVTCPPQTNDLQQTTQLTLATPTINKRDANATTPAYDEEFEELTLADALLQPTVDEVSPKSDDVKSSRSRVDKWRDITYAIIDEPPSDETESSRRHHGGSVVSLKETAEDYNKLCKLKKMFESGAEGAVPPTEARKNLEWKEEGKLHFKMERKNSEVDVLVNGSNNVYMAPGRSKSVYAFNTASKELTKYPDCPQADYSLAIVDGLLTTIGGTSSNQLFSLTGRKADCRGKWVELFPSMPSQRQLSTTVCVAVCHDEYLIVIGGRREGETLSTVEVMNVRRKCWLVAAEIPEPLCMATGTTDEGLLVVAGGQDKYGNPSKSVFLCSLEDLSSRRDLQLLVSLPLPSGIESQLCHLCGQRAF